jgi:hypothetical protein
MQYNQGRTSILQRTWRRMFSFIFNFLCDTTPEGDNSWKRGHHHEFKGTLCMPTY